LTPTTRHCLALLRVPVALCARKSYRMMMTMMTLRSSEMEFR